MEQSEEQVLFLGVVTRVGEVAEEVQELFHLVCRDLERLVGVPEVAARSFHDEQDRAVLPLEDLDGFHDSPSRATRRPRQRLTDIVPSVTSGNRVASRVNHRNGSGGWTVESWPGRRGRT